MSTGFVEVTLVPDRLFVCVQVELSFCVSRSGLNLPIEKEKCFYVMVIPNFILS